MARIYALAKDLNLDSKDLVDLVKKVGITGKGSALASLTEDEVQRVKEHLAGASASAPKAAAKEAPVATPQAVRETIAPERRPITIASARSSNSEKPAAEKKAAKTERPPVPTSVSLPPIDEAAVTPPADEPPAQKPDVRLPPSSGKASGLAARMGRQSGVKPASQAPSKAPAKAPAKATPTKPNPNATPAKSGPLSVASRTATVGAVRGDAGDGGKIRSLDRPGSGSGSESKKNDGDRSKRREPRISVKMASLPDAPAAMPTTSSSEPKAQKPDIKLSKDAIVGHKQGMKAPLDQLAAESAEKKRGAKKVGGLTGFTEKGKRGDAAEEEDLRQRKKLSGMASVRADRGTKRRRDVDPSRSYGRDTGRSNKTLRHKGTNTAAPRKEPVAIELPCTVRSFSEAASIPVATVLRAMMGMGIMANINAELAFETAELIATELDLQLMLKETETLEDELISDIEEQEDDPDSLVTRPPIVTFLGHVDHGKTSLLDYLIGINVVSGEAGGITQHIRAYEIDKDGRSVTFVDTPGHEAFTEMRARGANVTDIAVLVIAADDGIMPQTEEAISHAKAAGVPIVVALNKIDLEGVDANRVLSQLTEHQLTPSEWGGEVEVVRTSAISGEGMDELLETLLTIAELNEYKANPDRKALGVCLEAEQQGDRGVLAKLVVQNGTLSVGDVVVCGPTYGRVRAMTNTLTGKPVEHAGPSTPINLMGLESPPGAGDRFHVLSDITQAREIAANRADAESRSSLSGVTTKVSFENFQEMLQGGRLGRQDEKVKLNLIIRADVKGSLEAIDKELSKFDHPEVEIRVLQRSVGGITLADATLASASDAVIVGFNVIPDEQARSLADERNVQIRRYEVIYKLTDDIKAMIEGRLKPEERVVELGRALVKQVFSISRVGAIAGCYVAQGSIQRGCRIRVNRDNRTIGDYPLDSLKRHKEDVKEVPRGMECGIRLSGFNDIKQDDVLEAYRIEEFARTLD
ncbi:translation initiation factor IF-2 [Stieleria varia]|uniref:Translation initiation factor IF-2 n=1 Tax=Stieleria varia TaxID=2528005 RepID=A0A5C6A3Z2_9BACT|nr:translation initiation factor IF-2 [Stieleria varia]TWT93988.1 Translation initiation factor IF-2 [Stieleria varia]